MQQLDSFVNKKCHDCGCDIKIEDGNIKNGVILTYKNGNKEIKAYKCNECYENNKSLENYKECIVYSRIVGYMQPVQNWNKGKSQEFKERKTFTI